MSNIIVCQFKLLSSGHFGLLQGPSNPSVVELQLAEVKKTGSQKHRMATRGFVWTRKMWSKNLNEPKIVLGGSAKSGTSDIQNG